MKSFGFKRALLCGFLLGTAVFCPVHLRAEDSPPPVVSTNSDEALRSYLQLQEQLHSVQLSLEKNRQEAESAAARNSEVLASRLQAIEQSLSAQRARELESLQSANRWMLLAAGIFAAVGCLTVLCMAYFQWRTVNKLAEISSAIPRALGHSSGLLGLGASEAPLLGMGGTAEQSNARLLGTIERLEKRILEIEHSTHSALETATPFSESGSNGESNSRTASGSPGGDSNTRSDSLLGKGQSLLNLDQAEEALGCFNQILTDNPHHPEALIKKASALERLGRLDEALQAYDEAITADGSLTVAYLYKGGLYNRLERFGEALACYEQALKAQEKRRG